MSAGDFELRATYQGLDVLALAIDRKPGLTPDVGWIEVGRDQLKKVDIRKDFRLWQSAVKQELPGPLSLGAFEKIGHQTRTSQVTTDKPGLRSGSIIMKTLVGGSVVGKPVTLTPMFIMPSGFQEMEEDLANALAHDTGRLRINVVDFRHFWENYGSPMYGRYNFLLEDGGYDPKTVKPNGDAWPASILFEMVAAGFPGSPKIHGKSDIYGANAISLPDPVNIDMKMELPIVWMRRLLDLYEFELHLTFDSQILLKKRSGKHQVRRFRTDPGGSPEALPAQAGPDNPTSEVQTVYVNDSPEGMFIRGGIRQVRNTELCVPVFIDEFGQIQKMDRLFFLWGGGYNLLKAKQQRLVHPSKSYENVPGKDADEKSRRIEIARKYFFKLYAPASCFRDATPDDVRRMRGIPQPQVFWPVERERHPRLPMKPPWYTVTEAREQFTDPKFGPLPIGPALKESLVRMPVIVRANVIKQRYSKDFATAKAAVQSFLDASAAYQSWIKQYISDRQAELKDENVTPADKKNLRSEEGIWKNLGFIEKGIALIDEWADEVVEGAAFGSLAQARQALHDKAAYREQRITQLQGMIDRANANAKSNLETVQKIKNNLAAVEQAIKHWGFARLWVNLPHGVVEPGTYHVDHERGLIHFQEIAGVMNYAAVYDLEDAELQDDGSVFVTWMSDKLTGSVDEYSSWVFMRNDIDENAGVTGPPKLTEIAGPTLLKPAIVEDDDLVLMENEAGDSMNAQKMTNAAARIAAGPLTYPRQRTGYAYQYPGLWPIITDDMVNSVAWTMQDNPETGDVIGHTHIRANNPEDSSFGFSSVSRKKYQEKLLFHGL